jgi:hypothetical protein
MPMIIITMIITGTSGMVIIRPDGPMIIITIVTAVPRIQPADLRKV